MEMLLSLNINQIYQVTFNKRILYSDTIDSPTFGGYSSFGTFKTFLENSGFQ